MLLYSNMFLDSVAYVVLAWHLHVNGIYIYYIVP